MIDWLSDRAASELVSAVAWTHLHFLWQGCLLACAVAASTCLTRHAGPHIRYLIGCAALGLMAVAPVVTFLILHSNAAPPSAPLASPPLFITADPAATPSLPGIAFLLVVAAWALGAVICTAWLAGGWLETLALQRTHASPRRVAFGELQLPQRTQTLLAQLSAVMHVRAAVRLVDTALVKAPMTIGWFSPVILLPASMLAGLSTTQLKAIIAHELAHVRRWDYAVNLLQRIVEAVLFYHPAVWWVSTRIRQEREYCCDDIAAAVCGDRVLYARALAELESIRADAGQLALSSQGGSLMNRITRLLDIPTPRPTHAPRQIVWLVSIIALTAASATFALAHQPLDAANAEEAPAAQHDEAIKAATVQYLIRLETATRESVQFELGRAEAIFKLEPITWTLEEARADELRARSAFELRRAADTVGAPLNEQVLLYVQAVLHAHDDRPPIDRLIEAEELHYPWDIFNIILELEPEPPFELHQEDMQSLKLRKSLPVVGDVARLQLLEASHEGELTLEQAPDGKAPKLDVLPIVTRLHLIETAAVQNAAGEADVVVEEDSDAPSP